MRKLKASSLLVLLLAVGSVGQADAASISFWTYGSIQLRLETSGDDRTFLFEAMPAAFARRNGIAPGATFWQGRRSGDTLVGTAFAYRAGCKPVEFALGGPARLNRRGEIVLRGVPPSRTGSTCEVRPAGSAAVPFVIRLIREGRPVKDDE